MKNEKIDPNKIKTRDLLMVELIKGATKAGVHTDRKKKANKEECRKPVRLDEEGW